MAIEDFTTYTEIDVNNRITLTANKLDVDALQRKDTTIVYKSFGAGFLGDITHYVTVNCQACNQGGLCGIHSVCSNPAPRLDLLAADDGWGTWYYRSTTGTNYRIYLQDFTGVSSADSYNQTSVIGIKWLTIERSGNNISCKIYDDSSRTILRDTLATTTSANSYEYVNCGYADGNPADSRTVWCEIYDLQVTSNQPPSQPTNLVPNNGQTGVSFDPTLQADVSDPDGGTIDVYFYDASDDSLICTSLGVASGTTVNCIWNNLDCDREYSWYVVVDDGEFTISSPTFTFRTNLCPLNNPVKEKIDYRYKYKVVDSEGTKYKEAQKDRYKYKAKKQE